MIIVYEEEATSLMSEGVTPTKFGFESLMIAIVIFFCKGEEVKRRFRSLMDLDPRIL